MYRTWGTWGSMKKEDGFTLIETMLALAVMAMAFAFVSFGFVGLYNRIALKATSLSVVATLFKQQMLADQGTNYRGIFFYPYQPFFQTYDPHHGYGNLQCFAGSTNYEFGRITLRSPWIRYDELGSIDQIGQIRFVAPGGYGEVLVLHLGDGQIAVHSICA